MIPVYYHSFYGLTMWSSASLSVCYHNQVRVCFGSPVARPRGVCGERKQTPGPPPVIHFLIPNPLWVVSLLFSNLPLGTVYHILSFTTTVHVPIRLRATHVDDLTNIGGDSRRLDAITSLSELISRYRDSASSTKASWINLRIPFHSLPPWRRCRNKLERHTIS